MKEFALIFRHENAAPVVSPEQMQIWMKQHTDWISSIQVQNKFVGGTGFLFDEAKVVYHQNTVSEGPFGTKQDTLGGMIVVKAENIEEAVEFAKGSPILQGEGNTVEVRQIATH